MATRRPPKQQKNRNRGFLIGLFTMIAAVAAVIFAIAIFFRVNEVQISGNNLYSREEILQACGIEQGDNMLTIQKSGVASQIMVQLPYVAEVRILRKLPDQVQIIVRESEAAAAIQSDTGDWWLVSTGGKVLEAIDAADAGRYLQLTGAQLTAPEVGRTMQTQPEAEDLVQLLEAMEENELLGTIDRVDFGENHNIVLWVGDLYEIHVGGVLDIGYKMRYLAAVLDELDGSQAGTIDLTFDEEKVARFIPRTAEQ